MNMLKKLKSATIIRRRGLLPIPSVGEILLEEFLKPLALSQNAVARAIGVVAAPHQ